MAGDWIKMRSDLRDDPAVFDIAQILCIEETSVIGSLFCFWAWADKHSVDGYVDVHVDATPSTDVDAYVDALVDRVSLQKNFSSALRKVGWLEFDGKSLILPNFDRHNGESAKARSLKSLRQQKWRKNKETTVDNVDATPSTRPSTREEKRREDNKHKASFRADVFLSDHCNDKQLISDWLKVRKTKKASNTETAMNRFIGQVEKSGLSCERVLGICCEKSWSGFNADWVADMKPDKRKML